jgi:hypothetical protein
MAVSVLVRLDRFLTHPSARQGRSVLLLPVLLTVSLCIPPFQVFAADEDASGAGKQQVSSVTYDPEQSISDSLQFSGGFSASNAQGLLKVVWDTDVGLDIQDDGGKLFGQIGPGKTGFGFNLHTEGEIGFGIKTQATSVDYDIQLPVTVTLELPGNGAIAPEEKFTISTNWSTDILDSGGVEARAAFNTLGGLGASYELVIDGGIILDIEAEGCWLGNCQTGGIGLGNLLGYPDNGGLVPLDYSFLKWEVFAPSQGYEGMTIQGSTFDEFFGQDFDVVPDPFYVDVLGILEPKFTSLTEIGLGTDFSTMGPVSKTATTRIPKGRTLSNGWYENVLSIKADITNLAPVAMTFYSPYPHPPYNGTLSDIISLAATKADPTGETAKFLKIASKASLGALYYNIMEMDLTADYGTSQLYHLQPRPPEIRLLDDGVPMTSWFDAGDDITLTMPTSPGVITIETRVSPKFISEYRVLAINTLLNFSAGELRFSILPPLGPGISHRLVGGSDYAQLDLHRIVHNLDPQVFTQPIMFPDVLSEPRSGISGGGGLSFGGQKSCWQPDFLPPDANGSYFDDNDGCVFSFWDFVVNGDMDVNSYSDTEISFTLLNSTLKGQGDQMVNMRLNPQSDTSIQLKGETRMSGLNQVDLFFDDAVSTGNHNRIIIDTINGAFIRNSLLRGLTSNENQSDILLRNGKLWIENTTMTLDNITVENGVISMQDSQAEVRNLQVLGTSNSALRMTRDSLITTTSNQSVNSSNLEIGNGSLVNVSGLLDNQGALLLETGGWLTVLEGDNPIFPDRLTGRPQNPGVVEVIGIGDPDNAYAALALVGSGDIDPVVLFETKVRGSRTQSGVLMLGNGEIDTNTINNIGGSLLASGGAINSTNMAMSRAATMLVAHEPLTVSQTAITGTGTIDILEGATLVLDQVSIGDMVNDPSTLSVNNQGMVMLISSADFLDNSILLNNGTVNVGFGRSLNLFNFYQNTGTAWVDGTIVADEAMNISGGQLGGTGLIQGDVANLNGLLRGQNLDIEGHFTQMFTATTIVDFSLGASPVVNTETAELAGRLKVVVTQAYLDAIIPGAAFEFLTYDSVEGSYIVTDVELDDGSKVARWTVDVIYGATGASIQWEEVVELDVGELSVFESGFEY